MLDADGNVLLCQGYVIQTNSQLEQLFERGLSNHGLLRHRWKTTGHLVMKWAATRLPVTRTIFTHLKSSGRDRRWRARSSQAFAGSGSRSGAGLHTGAGFQLSAHTPVLRRTDHPRTDHFYAILCQLIARQFGLDEKRIPILTEAALSANLALVPIADKLNAFNKILSSEQRNVIRKHPQRSICA